MRRLVWFVIAMVACGGNPWSVKGAPDVPPDGEFRTGVEAGEDVYVWQCYKGNRVVVRQFGSACFGTRAPEIDKGPCGAPLPSESYYAGSNHADNVPESLHWPGVPATGLPPFVYDAGVVGAPEASTSEASAPLVVVAGPSASSSGGSSTQQRPPESTGAAKDVYAMRAALQANQALDRAYAKSSAKPGAVASKHTGDWVTAKDAHVEGDEKTGMTFTWSHHPPAGFEYDATVVVDKDGNASVKKAEAQFSPD